MADGPAIKEKHTRLDTRCQPTRKLAKREHAKHHQAGKYLKVCNAAQSSHRARVRRSVGGPHAVEVVPENGSLDERDMQMARLAKYNTSKLPNLGIKFWNAIILPSSAMFLLVTFFVPHVTISVAVRLGMYCAPSYATAHA